MIRSRGSPLSTQGRVGARGPEVSSPSESRPTIFAVAEAAGVSITTVSHVFSRKRRVQEQTRRRVLETAERLGYRPNSTAQALARGRTMTLGLQISLAGHELILNPFFSSLLPAMSQAAVERGYSFLFVPPNPPQEEFLEPLLGQRRIDSAVLVDPRRGDPFVSALLELQIPFVSVGRLLDPPNDYWVDNDHLAVCEHVLAHLSKRGYERTVLLAFSADISYVADYRHGFERALAGAPGEVVIAHDLSERAAFDAALEFLPGLRPPGAVFCIHDQLAIGVLRAASELGLAVPDELGVVSVGDTVLAAHAHPPLTSVRVFPERAGHEVIGLLDDILRGELARAPIVIPTRLVAQASTAKDDASLDERPAAERTPVLPPHGT